MEHGCCRSYRFTCLRSVLIRFISVIPVPLYICRNFKDQMLQINYIRQNIALVKDKLGIKHFADVSVVDRILEMDEQVRKLKTGSEALHATINTGSKEIGVLMGKGEKDAAEAKK